MSLTIITKESKPRNFLTYDLEWYPGSMELRLVGVYDGDEYRSYFKVEDFLEAELTHANRGKWFYAHAGGFADIQFIMQAIVDSDRYSADAAFSGSSAFLVKVGRYCGAKKKTGWTFVDSYWLLRDSLRNIGAAIGMEKGGADGDESTFSAPMSELRAYNEQDCKILWHAIDRFQRSIRELGGSLKCTLASTAMDLFRRAHLKRDVQTNHEKNETARLAYHASRVEVFQTRCENAFYFDINSSFPRAMREPAPGEYLKTTASWSGETLALVDADIEVTEHELPPLPYREGPRIYFPTGKWSGWFMGTDLRLLLQAGGKIRKVRESHHFEPFHDLATYVDALYEKKRTATNSFERMTAKLLLNSLYGKFAEKALKMGLTVNSDRDTDDLEMLFPGCHVTRRLAKVAHCHVPLAAHITAYARAALYRHMRKCGEVHYCDTDGFSTTDELPTGDELGALKLEHRIERGHFIAPKVYRINDKVRAKGFSRLTLARFEELVETGELEIRRMSRLREMYRAGEIVPSERTFTKRLRLGKIRPKRYFYPNGKSRPWNVKELGNGR